ncbi:MAG: hypothetical protein Q6373_020495 [Candidatus Sigynarchaeota archaeon]
MAREESGGRERVLASVLFFAGFTWFVLTLHAIVTRYLYMFSLSWFPFLAIIPPFFYPLARRLAPVMQTMILLAIILASGIITRTLLVLFTSGQLAFADDIALLASLSSFFMLACAFFDFKSLCISSAASLSKRGDDHGAITDLSASMLVSATCFAIGGTPVLIEPVIGVLLLVASIIAGRAVKINVRQGEAAIDSLVPRRNPAGDRLFAKERLALLVHVTSSAYLAFLACFLGGLVLPRTSILSGSSMDSATWRMVLVSGLGAAAGLAAAIGIKTRSQPAGTMQRAGWKAWFDVMIALVLSVFTGLLTIAAFTGPATTVQDVPVMLIVPAFHLAQAARIVPSSRIRGAASPLSCAWNGVLASLLFGVGGIALVLLIKVGMVADMALVACIAIVCAALLEAGMHVVTRGKSPGA